MYKQGYLDYYFEIELDYDDVEEITEDIFVLRKDLNFYILEDMYRFEYEVTSWGLFQDFEPRDDDDDSDSNGDFDSDDGSDSDDESGSDSSMDTDDSY